MRTFELGLVFAFFLATVPTVNAAQPTCPNPDITVLTGDPNKDTGVRVDLTYLGGQTSKLSVLASGDPEPARSSVRFSNNSTVQLGPNTSQEPSIKLEKPCRPFAAVDGNNTAAAKITVTYRYVETFLSSDPGCRDRLVDVSTTGGATVHLCSRIGDNPAQPIGTAPENTTVGEPIEYNPNLTRLRKLSQVNGNWTLSTGDLKIAPSRVDLPLIHDVGRQPPQGPYPISAGTSIADLNNLGQSLERFNKSQESLRDLRRGDSRSQILSAYEVAEKELPGDQLESAIAEPYGTQLHRSLEKETIQIASAKLEATSTTARLLLGFTLFGATVVSASGTYYALGRKESRDRLRSPFARDGTGGGKLLAGIAAVGLILIALSVFFGRLLDIVIFLGGQIP